MKPLHPKYSTTPTAPDDPIHSHLKNLVLAMIHAMNTRDFDPISPAWLIASADFISEPSFHMNYASCSLPEFLRLFDEQTRDHPEYFCTVKYIDVHVNSKRDHAMVFTEVETNGLPMGIVRSSVGIVEFVLVGKEEGEGWKCRKYRCMPGMEVLGVEGKREDEEIGRRET